MHVATLFELCRQEETDIFAGFSRADFPDVRQTCIEAILYTDNQRHFGLLKEMQMLTETHSGLFESAELQFTSMDIIFPGPEILDFYKTEECQKLLKNTLLHFADISNPLKPWRLCKMWAEAIMEEFFTQGDKEKELGLAPMAMHDRETTNLPYAQIGFIDFCVGPMVIAFVNLLPPLHSCVIQLTSNAEGWVSEWVQNTVPPPDEEEQAKLLERIVIMATKNRRIGSNRTTNVGLASTSSLLMSAGVQNMAQQAKRFSTMGQNSVSSVRRTSMDKTHST